MVPGVAGVEILSAKQLVELLPQGELARTVMFPPQNEDPITTWMAVVPLPLTRVIPVGNVQVYDAAFATATIEYVTGVLVPLNAHTFTGPVMAPGVDGAVRVTEILRVIGVPHPLTTTPTVPLLNVDG